MGGGRLSRTRRFREDAHRSKTPFSLGRWPTFTGVCQPGLASHGHRGCRRQVGRRKRLRLPPDDRKRLGMDSQRLRPIPRIRDRSVSRVFTTLVRHSQGAARWRLADPAAVAPQHLEELLHTRPPRRVGGIPHLPPQPRRVKIILVTPAPAGIHTGNRTTADRWARLLGELGNPVRILPDWSGEPCDLLIALHARRSFPAIQRFRQQHADAPLIVALTGTDLYGDLNSAEARTSLELASRIVVLQELGTQAVPESVRGKVRVIYQSAELTIPPARSSESCFQVCVLAHLRAVKDPLRLAYAARELPPSSRIQVKHAGAMLDPEFAPQLETELARNSRYQWLGPLGHDDAMDLLAHSHMLVLTSRLELRSE